MEEQLESSFSKLLDKLSGWIDTLIINLPNFLIALILFILAYWLARNLQGWANKYLKKIIRQPSIRGLVANVVSILTIILGLILALAILNLDGTLKSLLAGAGVAGLAISLALQGTLSNTFSGLFIAIKDELNIGDWIVTNGYSGKVVEIDLRNTKIKEADNNIVVVPNKLILDNPFKNFGLTNRIRTTITCGVGYESDLSKVKKIAIKAIEEIYPPNEEEQIEFYYTDFGGSSIDFLLRFWVDAKENLTALEVKSHAIMRIKETFDKNDINIPFPIRTIINKE
jgi:small conductance mechanosensitive channel